MGRPFGFSGIRKGIVRKLAYGAFMGEPMVRKNHCVMSMTDA